MRIAADKLPIDPNWRKGATFSLVASGNLELATRLLQDRVDLATVADVPEALSSCKCARN